jgi:flagellar biosynthesis chaperone FliJ
MAKKPTTKAAPAPRPVRQDPATLFNNWRERCEQSLQAWAEKAQPGERYEASRQAWSNRVESALERWREKTQPKGETRDESA